MRLCGKWYTDAVDLTLIHHNHYRAMLNKQILQQNIIVLLGIEALSDEKKIALLDKMTELVQKRLLVRVLKELPEKDRSDLFAAVDTDDKTAMEKVLSGKVPNITEMIEEEIVKLKEEMKGVVETITV